MRWFAFLFRKQTVEKQLDAELRFHIGQETRRYMAAGMPIEEARRKAWLDFGGLDQIKEDCRDARPTRWLEDLAQDARYGCRVLAKNPGMTFVVVVSLALGIGANSAIFSVVDAAVFRPLPYKDPDQLVDILQVERRGTAEQISYVGMTRDELADWRDQKQIFQGIEAYSTSFGTLFPGTPQAEDTVAERVSPGMLAFLGMRTILGRGFSPEEAKAGNDTVCLISEGLWNSAFASDRSVLGRTIRIDNRTVTIVGVAPSEFKHNMYSFTTIWLPLTERPEREGPEFAHVHPIARLRSGLSLEQAQSQAKLVADRLNREKPRVKKWDVDLDPFAKPLLGPTETALYVLLGAVGFVLLTACANVASLLLSRAATRQRELAIRAAIGASQARLFRQFLMEGMLLSLGGAAAAVGLAWYGVRLLPQLMPTGLLLYAVRGATFDGRVFAFTLLVGILTGVLCSLAPALRAARTSVVEGLVVTNRMTGATPAVRRLLCAFQALQVAFALLLLVGAGLMIHTFVRMLRTPTGYDSADLFQVSLSIAKERYPTRAQQDDFFDQLLSVVRKLPITRSATVGTGSPAGTSLGCNFITEAMAGQSGAQAGSADLFYVASDYFSTLGIPLLAGRTFGLEDGPKAPPVAIVGQGTANRYWSGENPLGKRFRYSPDAPWLTVVGVAGKVKVPQFELIDLDQVYLPLGQEDPTEPRLFGTLIVRSTGDPRQGLSVVRAQINALDRTARIHEAATTDELYWKAVGTPRFHLILFSAFAGLALATAAVGLYGITLFTVSRRTQEIGLRIALGAGPGVVRRLVVHQALVPVVLGIGGGLIGTCYLTRFMSSLLYQVEPQDPLTLIAVSGAMFLIALAASYLPALRASRIDPITALRQD